MGNYISMSRNDIIFSAIMISVWLLIRPIFVRMGEQAQARQAAALAAEAASNEPSPSQAAGRGSRKKLD
ncbi:hypothetical protein CPC16_003020 [Podila verticillata]|nr:hypothetical protein BGZ59_008661 [Podila verticillata]KAF9392792.1 hypothetical protein CPC16_003020 [Podila verticillata]KFH65935.1 hypothetical protein MVEG_08037 [Podila verticillata NRRL 6337]